MATHEDWQDRDAVRRRADGMEAIRHLAQKELARRWTCSARTLERWRVAGRGPRFLKLNGRVLYRVADIESFEAAHLRERTADRSSTSGRA